MVFETRLKQILSCDVVSSENDAISFKINFSDGMRQHHIRSPLDILFYHTYIYIYIYREREREKERERSVGRESECVYCRLNCGEEPS